MSYLIRAARTGLLFAVLSPPGEAADVQEFLHGYRHGYCPYALPRETSFEEILKVADHGYDAVGVTFCGPYNGGEIDWSALDGIVEEHAKRGVKTVIHVNPRFYENEGISDILNNRKRIVHAWDRSPNYAILDVFDPAQRWKFYDYLHRAAERYGQNPDVIGFCILWGYMGETGFYNGDFLKDSSLMGSECAGYSDWALREYNRWRKRRGRALLDSLPQPRTDRQTDDYIDWMRFRDRYVANVFQRGAVDAMKAATDRPIGLQAYLPASPEHYARNWTFTPNADFFRSAGSAATYDLSRSLIDSAIGWEDAWMHSGTWDFTFACMRRDEVRMIARGAVYHGMSCRVYDTEPQWEGDIYRKVSQFLLEENVREKIRREPATIGLFQPTWATSVFPSRGEKNLFLPRVEAREYVCKMTGLVESFGLPYRLVTETDLLEPERLSDLGWIVLPMSDLSERFLGERAVKRILADSRTVDIRYRPGSLSRSEFRKILEDHGLPPRLDYDGELPICGRVHNLVYNWTPNEQIVRVPLSEGEEEIKLEPHGYVFLAAR